MEAVQRITQGSWLLDRLAGQDHVLFAPASGKRVRSPKRLRCGHSLLFDHQELLWIVLAADHRLCSVTISAVWTAVANSSSVHCVAANAVWMWRWRTAPAQPACTYWLTPRASSSSAKVGGSAKKMGQSAAANGASCTSVLMRKRCRYGLSALFGDRPLAA